MNLHTQVDCGLIDEVTPSLTNMRELAPSESVIPSIRIIQSIKVEYIEEYIIVEQMDGCAISSLGCCRG
jgi:hypothetical protein